MATKQSMKMVVGICLVWCLAAACLGRAEGTNDAQEDTSYVKDGFYLGALGVYNSMSGDFDDTKFFTGPGVGIDVPDVGSGVGFGVVAGVRSGRGAVEFGYQRSTHDTVSSFTDMGEGGKSTAAYNVIDLNVKIDVLTKSRFRPYVLFGVGIPWMTIKDSVMDAGGGIEDATFVGFCLNAGAGVAYYFRPQWAVTGGTIFRWNRFGSAEGTSLESSLTENALGFTVGIAYTF